MKELSVDQVLLVKNQLSVRRCPLCGAMKWEIPRTLFLLPVLQAESMGGGVPVVAPFCSTCGHIEMVLAKHVGIAPEPGA